MSDQWDRYFCAAVGGIVCDYEPGMLSGTDVFEVIARDAALLADEMVRQHDSRFNPSEPTAETAQTIRAEGPTYVTTRGAPGSCWCSAPPRLSAFPTTTPPEES